MIKSAIIGGSTFLLSLGTNAFASVELNDEMMKLMQEESTFGTTVMSSFECSLANGDFKRIITTNNGRINPVRVYLGKLLSKDIKTLSEEDYSGLSCEGTAFSLNAEIDIQSEIASFERQQPLVGNSALSSYDCNGVSVTTFNGAENPYKAYLSLLLAEQIYAIDAREYNNTYCENQ